MNHASPISSSSYSYDSPGPSRNDAEPASVSRPTGLKLVLPPMKGGKLIKGTKRSAVSYGPSFVEVKKPQRPLKLKPLKEVLVRLISLIKKKDDYAFFLTPVDPSQVVGYSDVVKHPMDFGTIATKVSKGKYRSLEDFASDFRLVTGNAKSFNPPGTIYHAEADKIEAYGLDHISKAAPTVIEYETDWNIDIEQDDATLAPQNGTGDEYEGDAPTPMDVDRRSMTAASPVPSALHGQAQVKRGARGPYKKTQGPTVSDELDVEGRMPGSKDGVGAFPAGSDWAKVMLALKLRGKRYRTKKERLRMEKAGLPYCTDGSLDYEEMEDPFSILSILVPEPPSRPQVTSLYPPPSFGNAATATSPSTDPTYPGATTIPTPHYPPTPSPPSTSKAQHTTDPPKRRHWTILRHVPTRIYKTGNKADGEEDVIPDWQVPRDAHALDFGSFAGLAGEWAARDPQMRQENGVLAGIREGICADDDHGSDTRPGQGEFWNLARAADAQAYLRDVVYGGPDGLAYVKSLEEFVRSPDSPDSPVKQEENLNEPRPGLGVPLAAYIEDIVVDPITNGLHTVLRSTTDCLSSNPPLEAPKAILAQLDLSLHIYPKLHAALSALKHPAAEPAIDMASLIKDPTELFLSENEWAGVRWKAEHTKAEEMGRQNASEYLAFAIKTHQQAQAQVGTEGWENEGPEMLQFVLDHAADLILELDASRELFRDDDDDEDDAMDQTEGGVDQVKDQGEGAKTKVEDARLRELRLNLLSLAKRAPLDKIARLPADLVPENIRRFVPTLA
ncbi:hypothetical protein FIBSPDRAFT_802176 [Athelia psychrophila]|uniref:Bromo domain-containing protein n=1 Tax=Athelia psychrophila TaxID=1759441 RepID=A0A165Y9U3_9AGAM|nr:hypothetical protein FIBSPDRAFT_802176 [Fibularhizoctonia sp. CBS 109695]